MALSPADFAAYSRATGTPYPEDPEERAELAPEVAEFRRNQLQQPKESSNLLETLGIAALGLGTLVGAGLAGRRMLRGGGQKQAAAAPGAQLTTIPEAAVQKIRQEGRPAPVTPSKVAAIPQSTVDLPAPPPRQERMVRRQGRMVPLSSLQQRSSAIPQTTVDLPSPPATSVGRSIMPTTEEALQQFITRLSEELPEPTAAELNFPAAANRVYGVGYRERQGEPGYRSNVLAALDKKYPPSPAVQEARRAAATQDLLNASTRIDTATPTLTDIQNTQTVINTDQFINAVESGEEQLTGRVIKQLNLNDPWGKATIPPTVINEQTPIKLLPAAAASPREKAQAFLQTRFEELGATIPGRYRRERVMGMDPDIAEAVELYASTGDPSALNRLSSTPSSPLTVKPTVQMSINDPDLPTSKFFKPTGYPEYVGDLLEQDIELTNKISSLGEQQQQLVSKAKELGEQELMLRVAMERDPAAGGAYTKMFGQVKYEQQNLPDPSSLDVDLGDALAERDFLRRQMQSLQNLGSTYKLNDLQEGVRPYYEYDPLGRIIPETLELRSGRKSIDLDPKTGGGRLVSEYDPEGQSGSTRGIYGIEQTSRRSSPTTQPTGMTMDELIREGLEQAKASPEGDVPIPPSLSDLTEQQVTPQKRSSVNMSEAILRAARLQGNRNPRGGVLPDEITMTRRQLKQLDQPEEIAYRPREVIAPGSVPPQQLNLKNVTGYAARRRDTPADVAANQLEAYMSKLQRGRSTPLTSQAVIQPRLF